MEIDQKNTRISIIKSVQSPLGFFSLVSLLVEAALGALVFKLSGDIQQYALFAMVGTLILLIISVSIIAYRHPDALVINNSNHKDIESFLDDKSPVKLFENQSDGNDYIKAMIKAKPTFNKATIVQYSSNQIHEVVYSLLNANVQVELFIHAPNSAISDLQRRKIDMQIREYHDIYKEHETVCNKLLKVYLYEDIGTIRAIKLDEEVLMIGYYTYLSGSIHGHDNPVFFCRSSNDEGHLLFNYFNTYVEQLRLYSKEVDICEYSLD